MNTDSLYFNEDQNSTESSSYAAAMGKMEKFDERKPPEIVRIEEMDFDNLSDSDKELLCNTAADYIVKKFGKYDGIKEISERLTESVRFLHHDEFLDKLKEADPDLIESELNPAGFYDSLDQLIYFDATKRSEIDNDYLFTTFLHETFHFFSMENDAGFARDSTLLVLDDILDNEKRLENLDTGILTLCEGMTQCLTREAGEDLKLNNYNDSYPIESRLMYMVRDLYGQEDFDLAYFTMPLEEFRVNFEARGMAPEELADCEEVCTGAFAVFLEDLGACAKACNSLMPKDNSQPSEAVIAKINANFNVLGNRLQEYLNRYGKTD